MDVILRQDVSGLGDRGARVKVKPGYGRNYLIPRGMAYPASDDAAARIEAEAKRASAEEEAARGRIEALAQTMEAIDIEFEVKHEGGKLFGSVTTQMIAEALSQKIDVTIEPRQVEMEEPIKEIGPHEVQVHLVGDTRVRVKVWVLEERPA